MDAHSLDCLEFARVRELLSRYALSSLGRGLAERIEPTQRRELIARWLTQVSELRRFAEGRGLPPFGGITDVREIVRRCAPPLQVSVEEIALVGDTLAGTHDVATYLSGLPDDCPELKHLAQRIGDFRSIAERIHRVIDPRGQVRDDASPKLGRIRAEIEGCSVQIRTHVDRLLRDPQVRRWLQYANHTVHDDRWVLPVKTEYRGRVPGIIHRHSDSGATIYVEPAEAVELNNQITQLRAAEAEEIARLLWELAHEVYLNAPAVQRTLDALAVLDLIAAKARFAEAFGLRCPELDESPILRLRGARHPLLVELFAQRRREGEGSSEVVPIDCRLGDDFDLLVITGPNTGGKTVTLKTVGLLALMVQSGLPVPVEEGSVFGVFDRILIDIGDEQSLQQSLSTFSGHLRRQMDMLGRAGASSLVLIDEIGAGTDPDEGAAISTALLDEFLRLRARCIVTTHIGALKSVALTRERAENGCVEFDAQTLRPTYRLVIGEPGMSNAIAIAQHLGMPRRLVGAARKNLSRSTRKLHNALAGTIEVKRQAEHARKQAEDAALEATRAAGAAEAARKVLERQQADFHEWVRNVVHLQPGDAVRVRNFDRDGRIVRIRLDQQRAEVDVGAFAVEVPLGDVLPPQAPAPPPPAVRTPQPRPPKPAGARVSPARTDRTPPSGGRGPRAERRPRPPRVYPPLTDAEFAALAGGDEIYVKRFHRTGRIIRVNAPKKVALVSVGVLELEVPVSGLASASETVPRDDRTPRPAAAGGAGHHPVPDAAAAPPERPSEAGEAGAPPVAETTESSSAAPPGQ